MRFLLCKSCLYKKKIRTYLDCSLESGVIFRASSSAGAADYELQPELYRQAAQAYRRACYSMGEPFHNAKPDEIVQEEPPQPYTYQSQHH